MIIDYITTKIVNKSQHTKSFFLIQLLNKFEKSLVHFLVKGMILILEKK